MGVGKKNKLSKKQIEYMSKKVKPKKVKPKKIKKSGCGCGT